MLWGQNSSKNKGFSFIELSAVLASITAIIIMTIGSHHLVKKVKSNNITSDIEKYKNAITQFEEEYGALPGDIAQVNAIDGLAGSEGNGNGAIDTDAEALNVWRHLSTANIIDGNYDGTSENVAGAGVPKADIEGAGYNIKLPEDVTADNIPSQSIIIELAGVNGTDNDLPIITTQDAKAIDERLDDGNPTSGTVLAEGLNEDCVTSTGEYNLSEKVASCRLLFIVKSGKAHDDAPDITGACVELGQTRQTPNYNNSCAEGYEGVFIETCRIDEDNVGTWEITDRSCVEIKCADGSSIGDIRKLACINGLKGTEGIVEQCTNNGIWKVIRSDCAYPTNLPCSVENSTRKAQACDWGKAGFLLQTCTNHKWSVPATGPNNTCTEIKCGTNNIGDVNTTNNCGSNYVGDSVEVCTIAGTWEETSLGSKCAPVFGSCNAAADTTKDLGCSAGKRGQHIVKCIENGSNDYWSSISNTCAPIQCNGGENIGAVRVKEGEFCPNDTNGRVMEYCDASGTWQTSYINCVIGICEAPKDNKGHAYWPTSIGGTLANYTSCIPGYIEDPLNDPTRECNSDGSWGTVYDPCTRNTCPLTFVNSTLTTDDDATYPSTFAGDSDIEGTCDPNVASGSPLADCDIDGNWENERLSCQPLCPITDTLPISGVDLWLDADHECTVLASECDDPYVAAGDTDAVHCWKDKSGNGNHAISHNPHYGLDSIYTHGAIKGKNAIDIPHHGYNGHGFNMKIQSDNTISNANENVTLFFVTKPTQNLGGTSPGVYFARYSGGFDWIGLVTRPYGGNGQKIRAEYFSNTILQPTSHTLNSTYVYTYRKDATSMQYFIDGVEIGDIAIPSTQSGSSNLWTIGGAQNLRGENILYKSTLTDIEAKRIEFYLGNKWGVDVLNVSVPQRVWLDAEDEDTIYSDTLCTTNAVVDVDLVRCWADKSGNGHDAVLTLSDAYAPSLVSSGMNNRVSLAFDDDRLDFDVVGDLITSSGGEGFIAFYSNPGVDNAGLWQASHKSHSQASRITLYSNGNVRLDSSFALLAGDGVTHTFSTSGDKRGTNMLYNPVSVSGEWSLRFNGKLEYTKVSNPGINFTGEQFIGRGRTFSSTYYALDGYMGEVMTYDGKLSDTERDYVEYYLSDKWDIPLEE